jgi:hypothetical protein
MTSEKAVERSIDSLQRIYSVIVALAIGEGMKRLFLKVGSGDLEIHYDHFPEFIAFIFTAVPFIHGMNRHLDHTLATSRQENKPGRLVFLLIDFMFFLLESCVLFLLATSVTSSIFFFQLLMGLLVVDALWSFLTWPITKTVVWQWLTINIVMVILSMVLIYWVTFIALDVKPLILMVIAILRTVFDYRLAWDYYFPEE